MTRALVIGDTGGIGSAVADTLRARGVQVSGLSRSRDGLDIRDDASVADQMGQLVGEFDLIFVATGVLDRAGARPEKSLKELSGAALRMQFDTNTVGPALILKHSLRLLPRDRRAVFVALSARVGSIGDNRLGGWYGYRAAKAALNQIVHGAAVDVKRSHPHAILVTLHPGTVATAFTARYAARHPRVAPAHAAANLLAVIDGLSPADSGGFFDWAGRQVPW
ncbi:SDR family NAD(P)-dependent oxidoreductase [Pseudoruegeria sp. SK021]|uniref:SDR family NAD(P)-dependent oxidoreductase n=1 Tax=Pseudoruegeria sp. SK021 TaxID=1933035 RepID=UPI000A24CE47|nr:SDR family NAD(P)-dependent oxidoreductase [Pseudoruegeria sp. SK021]OSP56297.1 C factor, cell signaling protein [Pseudoruegeria sp. SK021]